MVFLIGLLTLIAVLLQLLFSRALFVHRLLFPSIFMIPLLLFVFCVVGLLNISFEYFRCSFEPCLPTKEPYCEMAATLLCYGDFLLRLVQGVSNQGTMNSQGSLKRCVLPRGRKLGPSRRSWLVQQDTDPKHS